MTQFPEGHHSHPPVHVIIEGIVAAESDQWA